MKKFNNGKPYHGSEKIEAGQLAGATGETDYFYFFCPSCPDRHILRILEYELHPKESITEYNAQCKSKAEYGFTIVFKLHCEKCQLTDFVKLSNTGWQAGEYEKIIEKVRTNI